jgi:hypothetical protein
VFWNKSCETAIRPQPQHVQLEDLEGRTGSDKILEPKLRRLEEVIILGQKQKIKDESCPYIDGLETAFFSYDDRELLFEPFLVGLWPPKGPLLARGCPCKPRP